MSPLTYWFSNLAKTVPLRHVLVVPFVLQIALAVGLTGWVSIRNGQEAVNDVAGQLRTEITARIQQYLKYYVTTPHKINQLNADAIRLGEIDLQNTRQLELHFLHQIQVFDSARAIYVGVNQDGSHIGAEQGEDNVLLLKVSGDETGHEVRFYTVDSNYNRKKVIRSKPNFDARTRPWYRTAAQKGKANWGEIYKLFALPKFVANASLPIYDNRRNLIGVAAVDFSLDRCSEFLKQLKIGKSGKTFIVERQTGLLVASSTDQAPYVVTNPKAPEIEQNVKRVTAIESTDGLMRQTTEHLVDRFGSLNQISENHQLDFDINGQRQFAQVVPMKTEEGLDWLIMVVVPESDFMEQINANTRTTILLCLGAFGLATLLGIYTAKRLSRPVLSLASAAKSISEGDLDQTVPVSGTKEINLLAQAFNQMVSQLRDSWSELERTNEELEDRVEQRTTELADKNSQLQQEIRERRKVEAALKTSELELRLMFAAMTDTVVIFDAQGRYLKYIQTQSSSEQSDVDRLGKTVFEVLPETVAQSVFDAIQQTLYLRTQPREENQAQRNIFVEYSLPIDDREAWFLASVSPLSEQVVLWVARDITKLKETEVALKQAKESADAANLAKSQFLSNMSHELRTPLNIILGFTQLLLRNSSLNAQQRDYLDTVNRSGEDLLTLINDVLEMSKIESGRVTVNSTNFDLYELLNRLQQMFILKARLKGLQLIFKRSKEVPQYICADESKLRQVLVNLIGNAIKFTQVGGVTVSVQVEPVQLDSQLNGHPPLFLQFSVEDTGCGISSSDFDRLFEPFVQATSGYQVQEGTGLGLPISQRFARLMGGDLSVESTLGQGSTFTFNIRTSSVVSEAVPKPAPSRQVMGLEAGQRNYKILITEDKPENRRLLVELLAPLGFEVQEAEHGQAAIAQWQSWSPDLIWMDIRMPEMNGFQATQHIKEAAGDRAPVIIALTGSAFEEDRMKAISVGFDDFVRKPIQTSIIFEKMAKYLGVRYIYADAVENQEMSEGKAVSSFTALTSEDLTVMSMDWIDQLHQAALSVDAKQVQTLIEQIPGQYRHLIDALLDLLDRLAFEELIELTQHQESDRKDSFSIR
jgi:signal transduction histidine kinase/CheY-like chemotaxis protein